MYFSYHHATAPMMWVLFGLMGIEAAVLHFCVALWKPWLALLLSLFSLSAMAWLIIFIRSLTHCPVLLSDDGLSWRCGNVRRIDVPVAQIAGIRYDWDGALIKARDTFNGALVAYPNIVIDLREPVALGRRKIRRLAHKLDDPQAFVAALAGLLHKI
ncbi:hypothetical protein MOK15_03685 [Sphingobium sp. BYY-5]|uniref:hypothetical protein n=1 Tax=Sphingobium sp. BYY-5 TaxID=2926400 RepID=UPI001FA77112|nr:hypothetical protein [Sphingobium sp. BYY-5]MCI4589203.1 hypothetical protein [Sphingobium sp. BYY-5]